MLTSTNLEFYEVYTERINYFKEIRKESSTLIGDIENPGPKKERETSSAPPTFGDEGGEKTREEEPTEKVYF